jgi:nickel transport protein
MKVKKILKFSLFASLLTMSFLSVASAHGVWIAERFDQKQLVLGEGPIDNAYKLSNVQSVQGYTATFQKSPVQIVDQKNHIAVVPGKDTAVISVHFDYGYWSKDKTGKYQNKPMNQVAGAVMGTHAVKYNVTYLHSVKEVKPVPDVPLQIIPQVDPTTLHKGAELPLLVVKDGKPLANAAIIPDVINDLTNTVKTDADGRVVVKVPNNGLNVIGIEIAFPITEKNNLATQDKYFSTLTFTLYPEED